MDQNPLRQTIARYIRNRRAVGLSQYSQYPAHYRNAAIRAEVRSAFAYPSPVVAHE